MVVEGLRVLLHYKRFVDSRTVGVASDDTVGAVHFEQDVFIVVDVTGGRRARVDDFFFHAPSQTIVLVVHGFRPGHDRSELVLGIVLVGGDNTAYFGGLSDHVAVVVVLVGEVGVFQKLVRLVKRRSTVLIRVYPVANGIVGEGL